MGKLLLPATFVLLLALCVGGYFFIALELDNSTIATKQSVGRPEGERR